MFAIVDFVNGYARLPTYGDSSASAGRMHRSDFTVLAVRGRFDARMRWLYHLNPFFMFERRSFT